MSKVQTFEEWWESEGIQENGASFRAMLSAQSAWRAAMENAARVCDEQSAYTEWVEDGQYVARCIREAAKR